MYTISTRMNKKKAQRKRIEIAVKSTKGYKNQKDEFSFIQLLRGIHFSFLCVFDCYYEIIEMELWPIRLPILKGSVNPNRTFLMEIFTDKERIYIRYEYQ